MLRQIAQGSRAYGTKMEHCRKTIMVAGNVSPNQEWVHTASQHKEQ